MKYGEGKGSWCTRVCRRAYGEVLVKGGRLFLSICLLWWGMVLVFFSSMISGLGRILLKRFILSYMCSTNKEACISEVLSLLVGDNDRVWSLRFYREFNDWELAASYSLLHLIQTWTPRGGECDSLSWGLTGSGKFDTRSYYHKIHNAAPSTFPWKGIWKVKVPKKIAFFMWTAVHGQILTSDNLILRSRPLANRCCMCYCNAESVDHLLLFCPIAHSL